MGSIGGFKSLTAHHGFSWPILDAPTSFCGKEIHEDHDLSATCVEVHSAKNAERPGYVLRALNSGNQE